MESLNELRARNKRRGQRWTQQDATLGRPFDQSNQFFPRSDGALAEDRQNFANFLNLPKEKRRWITDLQGTPTLHCLLPLFIELTAARVRLGDWEPSEGWMELVGQFMRMFSRDPQLQYHVKSLGTVGLESTRWVNSVYPDF